MERVWAAITQNTALAVLDGSFQNQSRACAWILEGDNSANRIEGSMVAPGNTRDHSFFK